MHIFKISYFASHNGMEDMRARQAASVNQYLLWTNPRLIYILFLLQLVGH